MSKIKYFCVSDVHSFYNELQTALDENGFDVNDSNHHLIICGDLFDRGPDTVKCFEFVKLLANQQRLHYVRGNHEDLLCDLYHELKYGYIVGSHHVSNGTVDTVAQLLGVSSIYDILNGCYNKSDLEKVGEVLDFIQEQCVDYFEVDDHIFVHGWIPCISDDTNKYHARKKFLKVFEQWTTDYDTWERDKAWESARWINGMEAWSQGMSIHEKTIVCGHWHCSWGWSHLRNERKEFPQPSRADWLKSFEPFIDKGIVAIDACTAYTKKINCYVLEANS